MNEKENIQYIYGFWLDKLILSKKAYELEKNKENPNKQFLLQLDNQIINTNKYFQYFKLLYNKIKHTYNRNLVPWY